MKKLLLTGFEPFGGSDINPSAEVVKALDGKSISNVSVHGFIVPLIYKDIQDSIVRLITKVKPDIIILLGQAPRPSLSFERVAINIADAQRVAYNCDSKPENQILINNGPVGYFTTMNIKNLVSLLKENNIPSYISNSAGTFGCNQIFYYCLHYLHKNGLQSIPCEFIHLPCLPQQSVETPLQACMSLNMMVSAINLIIGSFD